LHSRNAKHFSGKKRTKLDIMYDILVTVKQKPDIKITHLIYSTNLSHVRLMKYLKTLMDNGSIEKKDEQYLITRKGEDIIKEYKKMKQFMESFGL